MSRKSAARSRLLAWFDAHKRELPWRRSNDPYNVWISEIMLQQTQVERVVVYFERFMDRFPGVEKLAASPLEEVLACWSGLGYYRRARMVHAAARQIVARGGFPSSRGEWEELPGIGPYTAAAIASIAGGERELAVDGNVARVASRLAAVSANPATISGRRRLEDAVDHLLDPGRPGDSNQALMELGATICRPRRPDCPRCPLRGDCSARLNGVVSAYPAASPRRPMIRERRLAVVVSESDRILLFRRPDDAGRLAGLWEVPWVAQDGKEAASRKLTERYGGSWEIDRKCGSVRHSIVHRDMRIEVWLGSMATVGEIAEGVEAGWYSRNELRSLPVSSLVEKLLEQAL